MVELVPYEVVSAPAFAKLAAESFAVDRLPDGVLVLTGTCPRCRRPMTYAERPRSPSVRSASESDPASATPETFTVICTADGPYPGQPPGATGCGAYWYVTVGVPHTPTSKTLEPQDQTIGPDDRQGSGPLQASGDSSIQGAPTRRPGTWLSSPAGRPTPADQVQATERLKGTEEALEQFRGTAGLWAKGLGAMLAALVGFSLIKGRSDIGELDLRWALTVGGVLLLSGVAGAVAAFNLMSAQGNPWPRANLSVRQQAVERNRISELLRAHKSLRWGIVFAYTCMGLLLFAVGLTWYGPPNEGPRVVVHVGTQSWCGAPGRVAGNVLALDTGTGRVSIDLRRLTAIQAVARCPTG